MSLDAFVTWRDLLVIVVLVLLFYVAEMALVFRAKRLRAPDYSPDAAREAARLREDIRALQAELDSLKQGQSPPPAPAEAPVFAPVPPAPTESPYARAIQLAKQGLGVHEVALQCGISRGEAELIVAMHRSDLD
jgi:hypothetical protein